jgi:hypothetical protein
MLSMSARTLGSAFSFNVIDALVCKMFKWNIPILISASSGTLDKILSLNKVPFTQSNGSLVDRVPIEFLFGSITLA